MIKWTKEEEEEEEEGVWSVAGWMSVLDGSVYIKGRGGEGRRFHYLLPGNEIRRPLAENDSFFKSFVMSIFKLFLSENVNVWRFPPRVDCEQKNTIAVGWRFSLPIYPRYPDAAAAAAAAAAA